LKLGIHQGGGNSWLLQRLVGPQAAAAMILFGEALDGPTAERLGLVWRCVADDALIDESTLLAEKAASVADPQLGREMKATLRAMSGVLHHSEAVDLEIGPQLWSMGLASFADRVDKLR
jgi:enoyl-CoA hydratase